MIKKSLVVSGLFLTWASIAGAAGYMFTTNLTVGSTGADVSALQTWLISSGFHIPAIESGAAIKGRFGNQTRNAVRQYQAVHAIPSTGFVGPLTRASLNGSAQVEVGTASVTISSLKNVMTPGIAGTLAVSLQGSPSGASLDKGETEDVARYKIQAAASDMQVTSVSLDFDTRLWLIASGVTIKDDTGAVVASKSGLTASDFSELTVGSSYRLYVPISYVVPHSQTRYLIVSLSMLPISDRSSATVTIGQIQVRSVDGTGVSDTQTDGSDRTFTYTGTNSGQVVITANDQSPPNMIVPISMSAATDNIVMGVANFRSQGKDGILRSMSLYVSTNGLSPLSVFDDVKIQSGDLLYSADSIANGNLGDLTVFTNMAIPLPKDKDVPVAILVKVKKDADGTLNGVVASSTLDASGSAGGTSNNPVVEDSTYKTIDINDAPLVTSDITFSESDSNLFSASPTATLGAPVISNNVTAAYPVSFSFTITAGVNTLYVSSNPVVALATTSTGYGSAANASTTITSVTATPSEVAGDTSTYYVISAGSSRSFRWSGTIRNDVPRGVVLRTFRITGIKYGTSSSSLDANTVVYYNYGALKVEPVI